MRVTRLSKTTHEESDSARDRTGTTRKKLVGQLPPEITYKDDYNIVVLHQKALNTIDPRDKVIYSVRAYPLIQQYTIINPRAAKHTHIYGEEVVKVEEELYDQRTRIVSEYLDILSDFFPKLVIKRIDSAHVEGICVKCGNQLQDWTDYYYCTNCHLTCPVSESLIDIADGENVSSTNVSKSAVDKRLHFRNVVNKFEGLQSPDSIVVEVRELISRYIRDNNIVESSLTKEGLLSILKKLKRDNKSSLERVSKSIRISTAFSADGYNVVTSDHFLDINLLHHELTGSALPNLSHIRDRLFKRYDELLKVSNKKESGISLATKQLFFLYKFLQLEEYPCSLPDIPVLKTCDCLSNWETEFRRLSPELTKISKLKWSIT